MVELDFPKLMSIGWWRRILETCSEALESKDHELRFDLSRVEWVAPFGVTILAATVLACLQQGKTCYYIKPGNDKCHEFLRQIGFEALFLKDGEKALSTPTSVILRWLRTIDPMYVAELIAAVGYNLPIGEEDRYQIQMHLTELMQNAQDHADSNMGFFVCAQWYPQKGNLRISFVDVGRGIPASLRTLPQYSKERSDSKLISESTKPGVTTRKHEGGMGLYFIRQYLRKYGGTLSIISERGRITFQPKKTIKYRRPPRFPGTAVDIVMRAGERNENGA